MSKGQERNDAPSSVEAIERTLAEKRGELRDAERQCAEAEGAMDADATVAATQRAAVLRTFLARLETQLVDARESAGRADADTRLVGIRRAHGSLVASLSDDEKRIRDAAAALEIAIARMNDRYAQLARLRMEAAALVDRFGLDAPALPHVLPPALRSIRTMPPIALADYARPKPVIERCEHGLRERRTYAEIAGSDGHAIIARAGLKPFPPLTARQEAIAAQRAREREATARALAPTLATAAELKRALDSVPGSSGVTTL